MIAGLWPSKQACKPAPRGRVLDRVEFLRDMVRKNSRGDLNNT